MKSVTSHVVGSPGNKGVRYIGGPINDDAESLYWRGRPARTERGLTHRSPVRSRLSEDLPDLQGRAILRKNEGCRAIGVSGIHVYMPHDQELNDVGMVLQHREHQGRIPHIITRLGVRPSTEQEANAVEVPRPSCKRQRRLTTLLSVLQPRTIVHERANKDRVPWGR